MHEHVGNDLPQLKVWRMEIVYRQPPVHIEDIPQQKGSDKKDNVYDQQVFYNQS